MGVFCLLGEHKKAPFKFKKKKKQLQNSQTNQTKTSKIQSMATGSNLEVVFRLILSSLEGKSYPELHDQIR